MGNLVYSELLKLKRSNMFLVSIIGSAVAPFMCFISFILQRKEKPDIHVTFSDYFSDTSLYIVLLIGLLLYGVITSYVFNREYVENTLKNLLPIPVGRIHLLISKFILVFIWIMILTIIAWLLTIFFGLIGHFEDFNFLVLLNGFKLYIIGGSLLFLLTTPTVFITLIFKDYVPAIVFTIAVTMVNVLVSNSKYGALYPWTAVHVIATNAYKPEYPPLYSYIAIISVSVIGAILTVNYFCKEDIK